MRHIPPSLFGVPASVSWWHFQPPFHPSQKWMAWQERYQMSCRGSQWICHWVWLPPEWIVIYLYGPLVMLTDSLRGGPHPWPRPLTLLADRLSRSFGESLGEMLANVILGAALLNNTTPAFVLQYVKLFPFPFFSCSQSIVPHPLYYVGLMFTTRLFCVWARESVSEQNSMSRQHLI